VIVSAAPDSLFGQSQISRLYFGLTKGNSAHDTENLEHEMNRMLGNLCAVHSAAGEQQ